MHRITTTCLSTMGAGACAGLASAVTPNILIICAEDMSPDIPAYMAVPFETPGLDRLANLGVVFEYAYAAAPTCSPSRASMFTGLMPHGHGQIGLVGRGSRMFDGLPTFMDALRERNYFTGVTYKVHVDPQPEFDVGPRDTAWGDPAELAAVAQSIMETATKEGRPWFIKLNTFDTHAIDRTPAHRLNNKWRHQFAGLPEETLSPDEIILPPYMAGDPATATTAAHPNLLENVAGYYNSILRVDDTVSRLLNILESRGELENTRILFTADHGVVFPRGKQMIYETGVRVPLIVVSPEAEPGTRTRALANLTDMMPTIIEWAGGTPPDGIEGISLPALLRGDIPPRDYVGTQFFLHWGPGGVFPVYSLRDDRFKIIYNARPERSRRWREYTEIDYLNAMPDVSDEPFAAAFRRALSPPMYELYDLQADPWEFRDVSVDPAYAHHLARLQQAMEDWRRDTGDPFLNPEAMQGMLDFYRRLDREISDLPGNAHRDHLDAAVPELHGLMRAHRP